MNKDGYDASGTLLNELGQELAQAVGGDPEGAFLYVEIGEGWVSPSIFKDEGSLVRYHDLSDEGITDLIFDIWYAEEDEARRWSVMEYAIADGKFDVMFKYPEEVDVTKPNRERRRAALRARFGDKPVVYPPMQEGAFEMKP